MTLASKATTVAGPATATAVVASGYVQDYGAPVGWRLALNDPTAVVGVISQNGNAYEEGFVPSFWDPIWADAAERTTETRDALRPALGREAVEWQYNHGVADPTTVDPDAWEHDLALLARPGQDDVQLALFRDYATNRDLYPAVHEWLRTSQVPDWLRTTERSA